MKNTIFKVTIAVFIISTLSACSKDGGGLFNMGEEAAEAALSKTMIQVYQVVNKELVASEKGATDYAWMEDASKHNEIWDFYKAFVPETDLDWVDEFEIYDGEGEEYGYVVNLDEDLKKWRLGLAIDGAYSDGLNGNQELAHTVIHEQFHIMSLNSTQLNPAGQSCYYQTQEGCSFDGSYLDDFVEAFWADIREEHEKINPNNDNRLYRFYEKYKDQFVNDYAATNPEEDIAESFTYFVKTEEGATQNFISEQKVAHFYQYPELVNLRTKIRSSGIELGNALKGKKTRRSTKCKHKRVLNKT